MLGPSENLSKNRTRSDWLLRPNCPKTEQKMSKIRIKMFGLGCYRFVFGHKNLSEFRNGPKVERPKSKRVQISDVACKLTTPTVLAQQFASLTPLTASRNL